MFRLYREIERGEFFVVGADCAQGGEDKNFCQFLSATKRDIPLVYSANGVAAELTTAVFPALEWVCDTTGIRPIVAFERNNGGGSEMEHLSKLNRGNKYELYIMKQVGTNKEDSLKETNRLGYDTTSATRPVLLGDWKYAWDNSLCTIYDEETISQHKYFIINKNGKPEASNGKHDDAVMSCAVTWQVFQQTPMRRLEIHRPVNNHTVQDPVIGV